MRELTPFFAALSDPTRLRLLYLMKDGEICVCFLQGVLQTRQPKISRHLAYLRKTGLVQARKDGKWMHYRLNRLERPLAALLSAVFRRLAKDAAIRRDARRLQDIRCCPARYGFSSPGDPA